LLHCEGYEDFAANKLTSEQHKLAIINLEQH